MIAGRARSPNPLIYARWPRARLLPAGGAVHGLKTALVRQRRRRLRQAMLADTTFPVLANEIPSTSLA